MIDLKKETIAKHIRILGNLGCKFKVIEEDGTEHGELVAVVPTKPKKPRNPVLKRVDYKAMMADMKPGDVINIKAPEDLPLESLRSSISGHGCELYGAGAFATTLDRATHAVLVLRVE